MKRKLWRRDWKLAFSGLYRLWKNHKDLRAVIDIITALEADGLYRNYGKMRRAAASQILAQKELSEVLRNWDQLKGFAPGTLGEAYFTFMGRRGLDSREVTAELLRGRYGPALARRPNYVAWTSRHIADCHDILHVLTGYDTDPKGEACTQAFTFGQIGSWGYAAIALGGTILFGPLAFWEAWRRGRKTRCLFHLDIESLLDKPLMAVRKDLGLWPARFYRSERMA